ncbi:MAG: DUF177 domain-containing protein [Chloroflexi bacterium]|nr:DUF177 domain-containing protein [Chloroflexota bacterium]MBI2980157.1 DUF177 domain-containing protein [Chloroflexota bacterium]
MVQINVAQQLKSPIGSTQTHGVNAVVDITIDNSLVYGEVRLIRTNRGILVRGTLHTDIELTCSRCLSLFSCPLTINIEEEFFPTIDAVTGTTLPLPDEPDCFTIDEHNILDLTEAIRQYALMAIPMKPLCRNDCAGLCPGCGRNLNQMTCNCPPQVVNSRWSKLTQLALLDKEKGKE